MKLNVSRFCWKLERHSPHRLDLVLFCAPGLGTALRNSLPRGWRFRSHSSTSVRTASPAALHAILTAWEADDPILMGLLDRYAERAVELRKGKKQDEKRLEELASLVRQLLSHTEVGVIEPRLD